MSYVVAVVGATGAVGREMLRTLEQRKFPVKRLVALASARTAGAKLPFAGGEVTVEELKPTSFAGVQIADALSGRTLRDAFAVLLLFTAAQLVRTSFARRGG